MTSAGCKTFPKFRELPMEIQDHIWELAGHAHPHPKFYPGAQFFTIYNTITDDDTAIAHPKTQGDPWKYRLAAPTAAVDPRAPELSAYLIDSGLWLACRSSYKAVGRNYMWERTSDLKVKLASAGTEDEGMTALWEFSLYCPREVRFEKTPDTGRSLHWACPLVDLVVLQPHKYGSITFFELGSYLPVMFNYPITARDLRVRDVALELRPEWIRDGRQGNEAAFTLLEGAARWRAADWAQDIWLIDYGIKRIAGAPLRSDRRRFIGNRCRFVEVRLKDAQWEFSTVVDSYNLVRRLAIPNLQWPHRVNRFQESMYRQRLWGVLACVMDDE
ncbi:hypothetical protein JDV02_007400 [Purpureocillium takamizusanense]|uniref:Uncharacterized protein n=1 Tax=Purpureocillium takamizusanense TaxID=2060973 RepID=A0A9Q8QME8_9HYPO|nr:uncharacterized protein JDV02_007400 [Purpureocillium takamizusanense]UNI21404.1 hypothetical protein JDV02_007400 [Purpureocillium takamizusanense]